MDNDKTRTSTLHLQRSVFISGPILPPHWSWEICWKGSWAKLFLQWSYYRSKWGCYKMIVQIICFAIFWWRKGKLEWKWREGKREGKGRELVSQEKVICPVAYASFLGCYWRQNGVDDKAVSAFLMVGLAPKLSCLCPSLLNHSATQKSWPLLTEKRLAVNNNKNFSRQVGCYCACRHKPFLLLCTPGTVHLPAHISPGWHFAYE